MRNIAQKRREANLPLSDELPTAQQVSSSLTTVQAFAQHFTDLGIERAFGISGGAVALLFDALAESTVELHHFRHETGAAFAATEAYFASGKPSLVFATTGPGLLNVLTGITAAKWDGAKVILVSGATNAPQRGKWASQETSSYTMPQDALYSRGPIFDFAVRMEQAAEMPEVLRRLSSGLAQPGGFVAHVCMPMSVQAQKVDFQTKPPLWKTQVAVPQQEVEECARQLKGQPFVIWAGFGATHAADRVRELAERTGARVICSPRGKGILPEDHHLYLGVSGLGGHDSVTDYMLQQRPKWVLVLGTRLGEATSFWDRDLIPTAGFIHVDLDPEVPGAAYPDTMTVGVQAEIAQFLDQLLEFFPVRPEKPTSISVKKSNRNPSDSGLTATPLRSWSMPMLVEGKSPVRPQALMQVIQRHVVQGSDALVLSECGNAFAWCNHYLCFQKPKRYRVSTLFGSMGHTAAGVVGAALATRRKAVAVVGDGSMLMNSEVSSAVQYKAPAVWIVLNDAGYGMCRDGHNALGLTSEHVDFPRVDFAGLARSLGADGIQVDTEDRLDAALSKAMAAEGPFVVDVLIDPTQASPLLRRFESLISQGNSKNVAGWER